MSFDRLRVLVVDDNANMRRLLTTILSSVGIHEVREATSVAAAFEVMAAWKPDLVLVDYVMEGASGAEFVRRVRSRVDQPGRRLPIIVITGYADAERLRAAKDAGANDFITKPFNAKTLVQRIQRVVTSDLTIKEIEDLAGG